MRMDNLLLYTVLALMLAAAVLTVVTDRLFTAVVYAGALSAVAAFAYLLLGAPDVALAEVVIGATLATVIFLVTLKKYRVFTIYQIGGDEDDRTGCVLAAIARTLQQQEIEPHLLRSDAAAHTLLAQPGCDLVVERRGEEVVIHGEADSKYLRSILRELVNEEVSFVLEDSLSGRMAGYKGEEHA